jgi:septal ring factor EnvC (AmiA/AmiB activator)
MRSHSFLLRAVCVLLCAAAVPPLASASTEAVARLETRLQNHANDLQKLEQEVEFAQYKRRSAEEKLAEMQAELKEREVQLVRMRAEMGEAPTAAQQEALDNEARRIALAELSIKSRTAAITRLERKEQELQTALNNIRSGMAKTEQEIANIKARQDIETQARNRAMQQQLEALKQENEQLRVAMEEEARRAEEVARQAQLAQQVAVRLAEEQAASLAAQIAAEQQARAAEEEAAAAAAKVKAPKVESSADLTQVVLEGEPPIYQDEDTVKVTIRSRSIDTPVIMTPVGPNLYRAEVSVEPGRAFFDVRKRRYRGTFPEQSAGEPYVFYYDLTGERPAMYVRTKINDDQMISNAKDPF